MQGETYRTQHNGQIFKVIEMQSYRVNIQKEGDFTSTVKVK